MTVENPEQARIRLLGELARAKVLWFVIGVFTVLLIGLLSGSWCG
jgi:hypothetical protein